MLSLRLNNKRNWLISVLLARNTQAVHRESCHTLPTSGSRCLYNQTCFCISGNLCFNTWRCSSLNKICPRHVFPGYWGASLILLLSDPKQPRIIYVLFCSEILAIGMETWNLPSSIAEGMTFGWTVQEQIEFKTIVEMVYTFALPDYILGLPQKITFEWLWRR